MKRRRVINFLFILPCAFAFVMVILIPFVLGIYYSLTDWNGVNPVIHWVGLKNFQGMFSQPQFIFSFLITLEYTAINILFVNIVGFGLALLVTSRIKLRNVYRSGFFVPNLIGGIVLGYIWQFIFSNILVSNIPMADILGLAGGQRSLIARPDTVIWALSFVNTWQYAGYIMIIYVASIQSVPDSIMEAASVDGATYSKRIIKILIPMMANAFTITLFLTLTTSFKQFDLNYALTGGAPATRFLGMPIRSSQLLAMDIYATANANRMAEGQAKAVVFFVLLVVFSLLQVYLNKRKEVEA